jgi:transposase
VYESVKDINIRLKAVDNAFTVAVRMTMAYTFAFLLMQPPVEHTDYKLLYEQSQATIVALTHQLDQLKKMIFGSKSERFVPAVADHQSAQLSLALDADTITQCKITSATQVSYIRTKTELTDSKPQPHPGRIKLPEHLRREVIVLHPDMDVTGLRKIGDEVSEVLDYSPGELYVKQYIRPKYVQPLSELTNTVITASLPGRLLDKCMAGEGLLAQIVVDKYTDHLPLHRQLQRFQRAGVTIAQSTINDWVKAVLTHLTALYEVHKNRYWKAVTSTLLIVSLNCCLITGPGIRIVPQ